MSGHHHSQRLILAHAEFRLQNYDDELAGREVIIDEDDFMQTGPFDLYPALRLVADILPCWPRSRSKVTFCPSFRPVRPARSTAVM
jgi:hypothetical protein